MTAAPAPLRAPAELLDRPHHDGSYVLELPDEVGGTATLRLRVPRATAVDEVVLRASRDGEPVNVAAELDEETDTDTWYRVSLPLHNPLTRYRWLLGGGDVGYAWLNGTGLHGHDLPDADDFVLRVGRRAPEWHLRSVVYEIFPDRFATSGADAPSPEWAVRRRWDELPNERGGPFELFGGDLRGAERRLDHVEGLGASVLYLRPFFPAGSTHRYDATSFDRVDPLLGGDEALASLLAAAHARGLRILGDLTTNHTGDRHEWFERSERDFYFFDEALPHGYEAWYGISTLPKLDWSSPRLRAAMARVVTRWLDAGLDGWRIDVANMTGRRGATDVWAEAAAEIRAAAGAALVVAEHGHDFRDDLAAGPWDGAMNYAGFLRPVCQWLRRDDLSERLRASFWGAPVGLPRLPAGDVVATMRAFRAGVPWEATLHSWVLLDSNDTARFRTVAGRERQLVGVGLQLTTPGVPMVCAGDEVGLEGEWGEDGRRPFPWHAPESWDGALLEEYRRLIALRRGSAALSDGGLRYAHVGDDAIAYLREAPGERLLCLAARAAHDPVRLPLAALDCRALETIHGDDATCAAGFATLPADGPAFHVWRLSDG